MYDWTCEKYKVCACMENLKIVLENESPKWQRYRGNVIPYGESLRSWQNESPRWQWYEGNVIAHDESPRSWQNKIPRWQQYGENVKAPRWQSGKLTK